VCTPLVVDAPVESSVLYFDRSEEERNSTMGDPAAITPVPDKE